jgi:hypothetical protein
LARVLFTFVLLFALTAGSLSAQTLLKAWDFGGNSGDEFSVLATTNATGINATAGDVRRGGGLNTGGTPTRANTFTARNWDGSDLATARGAADYYKITIRPSNGNCMTLTELKLYLGTFMGAPIPNAVVYSDAGGDNFTTPLASFSVSGVGQYTVPLAGPGFEQVADAVSFRVYGFHDGTQSTFDQLWLGNTADNGVDDIEFYGYVAPTPGTLSTAVFDNPHCYGESQNTLRRLQVGGTSLNTDEVVVWRIVNFTPFPGSDTPAFSSGEYTQADNSATNDEFAIFNNGFSFRPSELATGVNNMPLYGTYELEAFIRNTETGCEGGVLTGLTKTINQVPDVSILPFAQNPFNAVCLGEEARFLASPAAAGSAMAPAVQTYKWSYSGSPSIMDYGQTAADGITKRNQGATYNMAALGAQTVDLDVTFTNGCTSTAPTHTITVNDNPSDAFRPAGTFVSFPFSENLDFDADHNACPGDVFEYGTEANTASINTVSWTLSGGGNILAGQNARNIQIEWTTPGTHTLSFLVTNIATGCTAANSLEVTVQDAPAVTINSFGQNPFEEVCEGDQAIFLASISSSGPPPVANYSWSFSGSPAEEPGAGTGGTGQLASDNTPRRIGATWADAGSETVDLMVTYNNGCSVDAPTHMVTVNPLPTVEIQQFAGNPFAEVCSGETGVYLANLGNPTPGGSVNSYSWSVSPAAPITLAGQSGDVSGRRRAEIVFPPNMGTAPVMYTVELTIEDANGCVNTATQVVEVRPELKLAFDFKNPPGFANNEICNGGTVEIDLDVLPGQEAFYNEGSDYEIRNVIVRHRAGSGSTFVAGYGPVSGGTLNNGDVISGVNETLSHNEAEPVLIQYNFVLEDLVCGTQDFRSVVVEVRPQLKLAFDFSAPPGFANNALCNGSTVDIGVDALPAQAALYGLGSDYQVEVVAVRHRVGSVGSFTNGYGPIMGGTLSNGDVITQINEPLSHDETASVFVQYNLVLKDLKCGSNDFRSVVVEIKPQPKIGFVFKNPPSAFCPNSNEICNGDEVNFDLVSEAEGLVEGADFEFRLLGAAYKIGGTCQGGGYTNGYGPVSGGISGGTTLSDYVATLSHSEADIVWVRLSFVAEDLSGCGNDDFRSVWVGVWPSPAGAISNSGPVCANADAFLTFEGTIGQPPFEVAIAELNGGNYTSAGAGSGNPFWTLQGLAPGSYTYTLTAIRDANGCETTGLNQQTTVVVLPEPVISCPGNITVQTSNNGTGDCTASASWTNPTESAGACTPITLTISIDNGTPQTVVQGETFMTTLSGGEHTVTYVVTDGNNNEDDCSFTVTVEDDERPSSIALPDVVLTTDEDGAACPGAANTSLVVDQVNPIATAADTWSYFVHGVEIDGFNDITDNCSDPSEIEIFVWEINEISTDECESSFKVFFRYYDEAGNWRQRGKEFTIVDDTRPSSIGLQDMTFTTEDGATCPGAADTDLVVDQSNPIATAADNWSFTVHGKTVQGFNNITDNCSDPSEIEIFVWETNEITTGDCESSFKVFFRYFDACGNFRQRGQTFTIQDNTKPDFNKGGFSEAFTLTTEDGADCPANATVEGLETGDVLTPGVAVPFTVAGVAYTTPTDMVSDNCVAQSDLLLTVDVVNEDVMNEGDDCSKLLRVRYKLEDGCGNQRFFTQEFTVIDNTKPDFNKGGFLEEFTLTTEDGADCPANAAVDGLETGDVLTPGVASSFTVAGIGFTTPTDMVSDNCVAQSDLLLTVDVVNEDVMNEGDDCSKLLRVRYKLEDGCGNQRFFTQEFTVTDNTKPDFVVPADMTIYTDEDCEFDADPSETGDVEDESDNCTSDLEATYTDEVEAGDCAGAQIITRTWSLRDDCGNTTTKVQIITVEDKTDPTFTVPENTTIFTDADCEYDADPSITGTVDDEADNCSADLTAKYADVIAAGSCAGEVVITRTWTLTDDCGNKTEQQQIITVEDNTAPTPVCLNGVLIPLDPDGERTLVAEDVFDFGASFDNCSTVSVTDISPALIDCDDVGGLTSIEVTASDDCGNEATCTATIEVSDITDLPSPWEGVDIGNPGSGSTYNYNPCVDEFIIESGAYNTPAPTDNLATISQTLCSNANGLVGIQLKIESVSGGFGGVFIRESNAPDAKYVAVLKQNDTNLLSWERRTSTGGSLNRGTNGATFPFWLRIFRDGNLIRAQYSNTGNSWIPYRQIYLEMGTCVEVGMVAYTTHPNGTVDAVFSNVQVAGSSTAGTSSLAIDQGSNGVLPGLDQDALPVTEGMDLSVFPNPATDQLTLKFGTELPELSTITLRNQLGQIMKQEQLRTPDTQMDWDISNLSTGTYFLEVRTSDGAPQVVKFLKTR